MAFFLTAERLAMRSSKYNGIIIFIILSLIWSSTWLVIKVGLEYIPPFLAAGLRFLAAFIILLIYAVKLNLVFPKDLRSHLFFIFFSLLNFTGGYAAVYWAEQYVNSGLASVLFSVFPFYVLLLSYKFIDDETLNYKKIIGVFLGFIGVVIIFKDQLHFEHPLAIYAMAALLISPAFSAAGSVVAKIARRKHHTVTLMTLPLLYSSLSFFLLHFAFEGGTDIIFNFKAVFSILYLGIFGTSIAFLLYFYMLKNASVVLMSLVAYSTPPLALIWGWLILGESITISLFIGMLFIFSGIALTSRK
jgi:drug/metabolite transporter (DMT)-like permease